MGYRKVVNNYYCDVNNLCEILTRLVNSYRLLIGGAADLNSIALARRKQVKDALERVDEVGNMIDEIVCVLEQTNCTYLNYCRLKSKIIRCKLQAQNIQQEIQEDLECKD
ncbi:hypothetical protein [Clostridium oceanicum]|uniref:Uncharacterized protein n=1 Tax=Clostridium oceanicum TaxID=1543 RepID=A0ABN1JQB6_9CLOT